MFSRHKWPSFSGILMIADFAQLGKILYFPVLIVIISVFSFVCKVSRKLYMSLEKSLIFLGHKKLLCNFFVLKKIKDNFLAAFLTADNRLISAGDLVTSNMVKVTGMVGRW